MPSEAQEFINEVWGLQGVAYLVLGLRYYSRIVTLGWHKFALDDYLIAVATVSQRPLTFSRPVGTMNKMIRNWREFLTSLHITDRLHSRIRCSLLCRGSLEGHCKQWHDR